MRLPLLFTNLLLQVLLQSDLGIHPSFSVSTLVAILLNLWTLAVVYSLQCLTISVLYSQLLGEDRICLTMLVSQHYASYKKVSINL